MDTNNIYSPSKLPETRNWWCDEAIRIVWCSSPNMTVGEVKQLLNKHIVTCQQCQARMAEITELLNG